LEKKKKEIPCSIGKFMGIHHHNENRQHALSSPVL